jgi:cyclophilin family peptidyl-prolyl cis-trans isomerase/HEAT repeat protein
MKHTLLALALLSVVASASPTSAEQDRPALNKWADDRLWAVLEAQEHRDTKALCLMLLDTSGTVREAAALALASVQDSSARPCLLAALRDDQLTVRLAAARALAQIPDSASLAAVEAAIMATEDTAIANAMTEAAFVGSLAQPQDAMWYVSYLESSQPAIRQRSAYRLARLQTEELSTQFAGILHALRAEKDPMVARSLMSALRTDPDKATHALLIDYALHSVDPTIRIAALRSLGAEKPWGRIGDSIFWPAVHDPDPSVSQTALDVLQKREALDGTQCWREAQEGAAPHIQFGLYGLALKHGDETTRRVVRDLLQSVKEGSLDPYAHAELLRAQANDPDVDMRPVLTEKFMANNPVVVRLAAAELMVGLAREDMKRARYASREAQYAMLGGVLRSAIGTHDAGLIAFACEQLAGEDSSAIRIMLHDSLVEEARAHLHPIRDLETLQLLDQAIAKRDGLPPPEHKAPPLNHPIDRDRLLQLKQGQRYRITTTKGEIIIATNVNETPGTSLVFDSLVTAGYYNGKAFHRVVPNFVIQGGCPRGDGYGGMPWTLRTEIGSTGFTAGSVGVASAGRDTESCQFFITHVPTPHLDGRYTKFAEVVSGMDVVQLIVVGDRMITVERVE